MFVLDHAQRGQADGVLECTGRDIPSRRIELHFDFKTCIWSLMKDSLDAPEILLPPELSLLSEFMRAEKEYRGDNSEFAERYNALPDVTQSAVSDAQNTVCETCVPSVPCVPDT